LEFNKLLADEKLRKKDIKTKQKIRTQMTFLFFSAKIWICFLVKSRFLLHQENKAHYIYQPNVN